MIRQLGIVLVLAAALAGCSPGGAPPSGPRAAPAATSASAPADPIPPVQERRNLAGTPPCQLLTAAQVAAYRIDQPGRFKDVYGAPGCQWDDKVHTREIVLFVDIGPPVLHNIYIQRGMFPVFEITQVAGHPAIRTKDNVAATTCTFRVAAAEKQTVTLRFTSLRQGSEEPCGPARALSETVIGNLPLLQS